MQQMINLELASITCEIDAAIEEATLKIYERLKRESKTYGELENKIDGFIRDLKWNGNRNVGMLERGIGMLLEAEIGSLNIQTAKRS